VNAAFELVYALRYTRRPCGKFSGSNCWGPISAHFASRKVRKLLAPLGENGCVGGWVGRPIGFMGGWVGRGMCIIIRGYRGRHWPFHNGCPLCST
jgi:hypothetical protein